MNGGIIVAGNMHIEKHTNARVVVFANGSGGKWFGSKRHIQINKDIVFLNFEINYQRSIKNLTDLYR